MALLRSSGGEVALKPDTAELATAVPDTDERVFKDEQFDTMSMTKNVPHCISDVTYVIV